MTEPDKTRPDHGDPVKQAMYEGALNGLYGYIQEQVDELHKLVGNLRSSASHRKLPEITALCRERLVDVEKAYDTLLKTDPGKEG